MAFISSLSWCNQSYDSSDLHLLRCERQKASDLLSIIGEIFQGRMGSSLFRLAQDVSSQVISFLIFGFEKIIRKKK